MGNKKVKKKVYCYGCDYFSRGEYGDFCNDLKNMPIVDCWNKQYKIHIASPRDKNKNNDCKDYRPRRSLLQKFLGKKYD